MWLAGSIRPDVRPRPRQTLWAASSKQPARPGAARRGPHAAVYCRVLRVCEMLTVSLLSAVCSPEFVGGRDTAFPQSENNEPRPSQFLRLQREEEEEPVSALDLPSCER